RARRATAAGPSDRDRPHRTRSAAARFANGDARSGRGAGAAFRCALEQAAEERSLNAECKMQNAEGRVFLRLAFDTWHSGCVLQQPARPRYNPRMKRAHALALLLCAGAMATVAVHAQPPSPAVRPLVNAGAKDLADGKKIFDAQCGWCHGAEGTGGTGPNLQRTTLRNAANDAALAQLVRNGIPGTEMPSFAIALTERMAWQTASYVKSLGRTRARPLPGSAERGASLYDTSGCANCHVVS